MKPSLAIHVMGALLWLGMSSVGCAPRSMAIDPAYRAEVEAWQKNRDASLRSPNGWLTVAGLHWIDEGEQAFGSAKDNGIVIQVDGFPAHAGTLVRQGQVVQLRSPDAALRFKDGSPAVERVLGSDADPAPDVLRSGDVTLSLIARGGKLGLRVKNPANPARAAFSGLSYFDIDPGQRVVGKLKRFPQPRPRQIQSVNDVEQTMYAPGIVEFKVLGRTLQLLPLANAAGDNDVMFVFRDATSGVETYGAGRFLDSTIDAEDQVLLDFNRAYSPPCAFTPFATCPLPPPENLLPLRVAAGEKYTAAAH